VSDVVVSALRSSSALWGIHQAKFKSYITESWIGRGGQLAWPPR